MKTKKKTKKSASGPIYFTVPEPTALVKFAVCLPKREIERLDRRAKAWEYRRARMAEMLIREGLSRMDQDDASRKRMTENRNTVARAAVRSKTIASESYRVQVVPVGGLPPNHLTTDQVLFSNLDEAKACYDELEVPSDQRKELGHRAAGKSRYVTIASHEGDP